MVRKVAVERVGHAVWRFRRANVDAVLAHLLLKDGVDPIGDLLDEGRHRVRLLILDDTVKRLVVAVRRPFSSV